MFGSNVRPGPQHAKRFVFIGASYLFNHRVIRDFLLAKRFAGSTFTILDIDATPLKLVTDLCKRMVGAMVKSAAWIKSAAVVEVAQAIRPFFSSLDEKVYISALSNVREAVIPDGRMTAAASEAYQKVLIQTGHLKAPVAFDAIFTNRYLPA